MIHILYPESRLVSEDTVIGWAIDDIVNAKIKAGEFTDDEDGTKLETFVAAMERPTLDEAKALLEDNGSVTFTSRRR